MCKGIVIRGIAGFYYVKVESGDIYECKAKGIFRKENITPLVGDRVEIELIDSKHGVISKIFERKNFLIRPNVANVDQALVVFAAKNPSISISLLNRLLIAIEHNNIEAVLCFNKSDLDKENMYDEIIRIYGNVGYRIIPLSGLHGTGIEEVKEVLKNKITVFAGPSGVGKSTLFNKLQDKVKMETGDVSTKANRGKHTTRHAELIELDENSYIVDTPGFSTIDLTFIKPSELQYNFIEFNDYIGKCRFTSCNHIGEAGCVIKEAVDNGEIALERYNSYVEIYKEILDINRRIYK